MPGRSGALDDLDKFFDRIVGMVEHETDAQATPRFERGVEGRVVGTTQRLIPTTSPSGAGAQTESHVCGTSSWNERGARAPGV